MHDLNPESDQLGGGLGQSKTTHCVKIGPRSDEYSRVVFTDRKTNRLGNKILTFLFWGQGYKKYFIN